MIDSASGWFSTPAFALRVFLVVIVCAALAFANDARATPPRGLTAYGRIAWNFEALARATFGTPDLCARFERPTLDFTRALCSSNVALADQVIYDPIFANAKGSAFALTGTPPGGIGNVAYIQIAGRYVLCAAGVWLAETSTGSWECA
jgi:hypothetical protein